MNIGEMITYLCRFNPNDPVYILVNDRHIALRAVKKSNKVKGYENNIKKPVVLVMNCKDENNKYYEIKIKEREIYANIYD
jgi:hypothetical protein